ncbi:MAG TPA: hypothetical protein EYO58_09035 [Flavobacteriales bacterium]|nr:hypothetical protein [Flavobacteriales bacterium]
MIEKAKNHTHIVFVHTDPTPLLNLLPRQHVHVILFATSLNTLARNIIHRPSSRPTQGVLGNRHTGYSFYFEPTTTTQKDNTLLLHKKDLHKFPVSTQKDKDALDTFRASFFDKHRKTTRITPRDTIDFDEWIILQ